MDALDDELERFRTRYATGLEGRWATVLDGDVAAHAHPGYGVWTFRDGRGHRQGKGTSESFAFRFVAPFTIEISWSSGDVEIIEYDFSIVNAGARRLVMNSRGRSVFAFEIGPLALLAFA